MKNIFQAIAIQSVLQLQMGVFALPVSNETMSPKWSLLSMMGQQTLTGSTDGQKLVLWDILNTAHPREIALQFEKETTGIVTITFSTADQGSDTGDQGSDGSHQGSDGGDQSSDGGDKGSDGGDQGSDGGDQGSDGGDQSSYTSQQFRMFVDKTTKQLLVEKTDVEMNTEQHDYESLSLVQTDSKSELTYTYSAPIDGRVSSQNFLVCSAQPTNAAKPNVEFIVYTDDHEALPDDAAEECKLVVVGAKKAKTSK